MLVAFQDFVWMHRGASTSGIVGANVEWTVPALLDGFPGVCFEVHTSPTYEKPIGEKWMVWSAQKFIYLS